MIPLDYMIYERKLRDKSATVYDSSIPLYQHFVEWETIADKIKHRRKQLILDAGCGTGRFSERLEGLGHRVVGIDFSSQSLEIARRRCIREETKFIVANVLDMPFPKGEFDVAISAEVLEHILEYNDQIRFLQELKRVLNRGGTLILTTYNYHITDRIKGDKKSLKGEKICNYFKLTKMEFYRLLREVFERSEIEHIHGTMNFIKKPFHLGKITCRCMKCLGRADILLGKTPVSTFLGSILLAKVVTKGGTRIESRSAGLFS